METRSKRAIRNKKDQVVKGSVPTVAIRIQGPQKTRTYSFSLQIEQGQGDKNAQDKQRQGPQVEGIEEHPSSTPAWALPQPLDQTVMHCKAHFLPTLRSAWEICTEWAASESISLFEEVLSANCSSHLFKWQNLYVAQAGVELGNYIGGNSLELMFLPLPPSARIAPEHHSLAPL